MYLVDVVPTGTVESPAVDLSLWGEAEADDAEIESIVELITQMANLRLDLRPFYRRFEKDRVIGSLAKQLLGIKPVRTQTMYEGLIVAILGQQISVIAAASIQRRLVERFGRRIALGGRTYYSFPRPSALAKATVEQLKECALSTMKAQYVRDVSRAVVGGGLNLDSLFGVKDSEEIIERLTSIRGIGRWTAEMAAIRGLARYDVVPAGDIGLRKNVAAFYGLKAASEEDVRGIARSWGEWKGMATYYLYVASRLSLSIERS